MNRGNLPHPPPPTKPILNPPPLPGKNTAVVAKPTLQQELESRVLKSEDKYIDCATSLYGFEILNQAEEFLCKLCGKKTTSQSAHINTHASQVLPWLFLGSMNNSQDQQELESCKIDTVINCTSECGNPFAIHYNYYNFPLADSYDNSYLIKEASYLLENLRIDNHKVFIHCVQGVCRAVSVVIYYLMRFNGMTLRDSFFYVKSLRSIAKPRRALLYQLINLEKELYGTATFDVNELWENEDD